LPTALLAISHAAFKVSVLFAIVGLLSLYLAAGLLRRAGPGLTWAIGYELQRLVKVNASIERIS
jgi:hypothetical protein